jgi:hypothetical protein
MYAARSTRGVALGVALGGLLDHEAEILGGKRAFEEFVDRLVALRLARGRVGGHAPDHPMRVRQRLIDPMHALRGIELQAHPPRPDSHHSIGIVDTPRPRRTVRARHRG